MNERFASSYCSMRTLWAKNCRRKSTEVLHRRRRRCVMHLYICLGLWMRLSFAALLHFHCFFSLSALFIGLDSSSSVCRTSPSYQYLVSNVFAVLGDVLSNVSKIGWRSRQFFCLRFGTWIGFNGRFSFSWKIGFRIAVQRQRWHFVQDQSGQRLAGSETGKANAHLMRLFKSV